jgi:hypothetical protein
VSFAESFPRDMMQETFRNLAAIGKKQEDPNTKDNLANIRNVEKS